MSHVNTLPVPERLDQVDRILTAAEVRKLVEDRKVRQTEVELKEVMKKIKDGIRRNINCTNVTVPCSMVSIEAFHRLINLGFTVNNTSWTTNVPDCPTQNMTVSGYIIGWKEIT
jgi:hypothetical protein